MSYQIRSSCIDNIEVVELQSALAIATIAVQVGNTLISFKNQQQETIYFPYTLAAYQENNKLAGNPFMHPWANRLQTDSISIKDAVHHFPSVAKHLLYRDGNQLALHGLLLKSNQWKTVELKQTENSCYHIAELSFHQADLLSVFPFKHTIQIRHELTDNILTITTTIHNESDKSMPISFGYHPYFMLPPSHRNTASLTIPYKDILLVDDTMIPTGETIPKQQLFPFEDNRLVLDTHSLDHGFVNPTDSSDKSRCFKFDKIEIGMDANYPVAQIYAPYHSEKPYVCIEPMTAVTNALNTDTANLLPSNETCVASFYIKIDS